MHECPFCGEECDCDMDDCGGLPVPDDCPHVCAEPEEFDDDYDLEDDCCHFPADTNYRLIDIFGIIYIGWWEKLFWKTVRAEFYDPPRFSLRLVHISWVPGKFWSTLRFWWSLL